MRFLQGAYDEPGRAAVQVVRRCCLASLDLPTRLFLWALLVAALVIGGSAVYVELRSSTWQEVRQSVVCFGKSLDDLAPASNVWGSSMFPWVNEHTTFYYAKPLHGSLVVPGEVVLYKQGDYLVMHRVTATYPFGFFMRGDNEPRSTGPHDYASVEAVVCATSWTAGPLSQSWKGGLL